MKAARELVEKARVDALAIASGPVITVRSSVEAYIAIRDARDSRRAARDKNSDAASRLRRYVIGRPVTGQRKAIVTSPIADVALHYWLRVFLSQQDR
jgi:hypothetical protein